MAKLNDDALQSLIEKLSDTMDPTNAEQMVRDALAPFAVGVAYMPVPRCDSCRWWSDAGRLGRCAAFDGELITSPSFGCVKWEPKS